MDKAASPKLAKPPTVFFSTHVPQSLAFLPNMAECNCVLSQPFSAEARINAVRMKPVRMPDGFIKQKRRLFIKQPQNSTLCHLGGSCLPHYSKIQFLEDHHGMFSMSRYFGTYGAKHHMWPPLGLLSSCGTVADRTLTPHWIYQQNKVSGPSLPCLMPPTFAV